VVTSKLYSSVTTFQIVNVSCPAPLSAKPVWAKTLYRRHLDEDGNADAICTTL